MNTYHAYYNMKQIELQAETSYKAHCKAVELFKANGKKSRQVTVVLVALADGKDIVHTAVD